MVLRDIVKSSMGTKKWLFWVLKDFFVAFTRIFHDLFWGFSLYLPGDVFDVVSSPLLIGFDELVKVTLVPNCEALGASYCQ